MHGKTKSIITLKKKFKRIIYITFNRNIMKISIGMLVMLIGLTANTQTNQDYTTSVTPEQVESFLSGDSMPNGLPITMMGNTKLCNGVSYGIDFESNVFVITIKETGVSYAYDLIPSQVKYKNNDGSVVRHNPKN